jgi:hypothetical protein
MGVASKHLRWALSIRQLWARRFTALLLAALMPILGLTACRTASNPLTMSAPTVLAGVQSVTVSWQHPTGAAARYLVLGSDGGVRNCAKSPCGISGLLSGAHYSFKVAAVGLKGTAGLWSPSSRTLVPASPPPVVVQAASPQPPPPTYVPVAAGAETVGGLANTWTNYTNAGGYAGPQIPAFQTVQIACKLTGFRVADGNTWWYRIASAPWNNGYYVSADAFYNNGASSGSLIGTPWVDPAIPDCTAGGGHNETTGGVANTWTNYTSAGGAAGPQIGSHATVDIACKLPGFRVADGNTWWYRIASAPWNSSYYVSADAFYNDGATSGSLIGTPFVDAAVPDCAQASGSGGGSPPPTVSLAQGPVAPAGYRYAVSLSGFPGNSTVTLECYDSVSPAGFYAFSLKVQANGMASTQSYCYSGDGPDHWLVANARVESNHIAWGAGAAPSGSGSGGSGPGAVVGGNSGGGNGSPLALTGVYFSPSAGESAPAGTTVTKVPLKDWTDPIKRCDTSHAISSVKSAIVLAGWSKGRLGPIYALARATSAQLQQISYVMLIDPDSTTDMSGGCDSQPLQVNGVLQFRRPGQILAEWLNANPQAHLVVMAGILTQDTAHPINGHAHAGIQNFYFNDVRQYAPAARDRILVCDYPLSHTEMYGGSNPYIQYAPFSCPKLGVGAVAPTGQWHP